MHLDFILNIILQWGFLTFMPLEITTAGSAMDKEPKSVVVIGAGVSGLAAAAKLVKTGKFNVTVLEAANRIGGRVFSNKFDGYFVEMGAEWVHGQEDNAVYELIESVNSDLLATEITEDQVRNDYWSDIGFPFVTQSGVVLNESVNTAITAIMEEIDGEDDYDHDVHKHDAQLTSKAAAAKKIYEDADPIHPNATIRTAALDWIHRYWNTYDASDHWENTSYGSITDPYVEPAGNPNMPWKPPFTFSALLSIILTGKAANIGDFEIPSWIQLNREVVEIKYSLNSSTVTVTCKDGTVFTADHVISTVSLGVLKANHKTLFQPKLSAKKQHAIDKLGFGVVNKITFAFEEPWWPVGSDGFLGFNLLWEDFENVTDQWKADATPEELLAEYDGIPVWCRNLLGFELMPNHPRAMRTWMTGGPARFVETLDPEYVKATCHKVMKKFIGHLYEIPDPNQMIMSNWYTNPLVRGSYSCRTLESEKSNVWAADLAEPILNSDGKPIVCFAGEASSPKFYANVNGAYSTGIREADRLINLNH